MHNIKFFVTDPAIGVREPSKACHALRFFLLSSDSSHGFRMVFAWLSHGKLVTCARLLFKQCFSMSFLVSSLRFPALCSLFFLDLFILFSFFSSLFSLLSSLFFSLFPFFFSLLLSSSLFFLSLLLSYVFIISPFSLLSSFCSPLSSLFSFLSLFLRRLEAGSDWIAAAHRFPLPVYAHDIRMVFAWFSHTKIVNVYSFALKARF